MKWAVFFAGRRSGIMSVDVHECYKPMYYVSFTFGVSSLLSCYIRKKVAGPVFLSPVLRRIITAIILQTGTLLPT